MSQAQDEYLDPRLVELYHLENPRGPDADFYEALAAELGARRIIDLGCGPGLLARALATPGREVMGVDPSAAMLAFARHQPGAERVRWVHGGASALGRPMADLVVMTGNVAQVFLEDDDLLRALSDMHAALRPGGHLAFESRNPEDRAWERWNKPSTHAKYESSYGAAETWVEVVRVEEHRVAYEAHNLFVSTGEDVVVRSALRFRSPAEITRSLEDTGFDIEQVYGNWNKTRLTSTSRIMIFVARRD